MTEVLTYEALKADRDAQQKRADALAVENAAMKDIASGGAFVMRKALMKYEFGIGMTEQAKHFIRDVKTLKTPATDAALAAIEARGEARGVEKFAAQQEQLAADYRKLSPGCYGEISSAENALMARDFAAKLREAK